MILFPRRTNNEIYGQLDFHNTATIFLECLLKDLKLIIIITQNNLLVVEINVGSRIAFAIIIIMKNIGLMRNSTCFQ